MATKEQIAAGRARRKKQETEREKMLRATRKAIQEAMDNTPVRGKTTRAEAQEGARARRGTRAAGRSDASRAKPSRGILRASPQNDRNGGTVRSVRDGFLSAAEKGLPGSRQTTEQRMQGRSEDWARLERRKQETKDSGEIKKIEKQQKTLHQQNVKDSKGLSMTYGKDGTWTKDGKPVFTPQVLPTQTREQQRAGTAASMGQGILPPSAQDALREYREKNAAPSAGERVKSGAESIGKSFIGFLPAIAETAAQDARNAKADWDNAEMEKLYAQAAKLHRELNTRGMPGNRKEKAAQYAALMKQIDALRNKTAVDQDQYGQRMMRESAQAAQEATEGMTGFGKVAADTALSIGQNLPAVAASAIPVVGPYVGAGMLGGQAAAGKMTELNARGLPAGEALGRGIVSGTIEAATEKIPLDKLLDIAKTGGKSAVVNVLKQAGVEAAEESASYIMNYAADAAAGDPEAAFRFEELGSAALGGALSGGVMAGAGTAGNRAAGIAGTRTPKAQPVNVPEEAKTRAAGLTMTYGQPPGTPSVSAGGAAASPEGAAPQQPVKVGRATTIFNPYSGKMPENGKVSGSDIQIPKEAVSAAQQTIDEAAGTGHFKKSVKTVLQNLFSMAGGQRKVTLQNVTFDGKSYEVSLNPNIAAKVASDKNISAEKLAVFSNLDEAVKGAEFVGSGVYGKERAKAGDVIRYDYFERPLVIDGSIYVMTFDVEVYKDRNNFRTYRVINEIDLTPADAVHQSLSGSGVREESDLSTQSIAQGGEKDNQNEIDLTPIAATHRSGTGGLTTAVSDLSTQSIAQNQGGNKGTPSVSAGGAATSPAGGDAGLTFGQPPQGARTSIDTDPETHTPEQMVQIQEYVDSVDTELKTFVQGVMDGKQAAPYTLGNVSDRAAQDIKAITGVDTTGFQTKIEPRMIEHIIARHGQSGAADSSMANIDDIARMQYVIDHYDAILDGGRVQSYKEPRPGKPTQNRAARSVVYVKKVDGSYYVVEAVPDSKKRTAYVVSAYIQKNAEPKIPITSQDASGGIDAVSMVPRGEELSIHDALQNASGSTSANDSTVLLDSSIPQNQGGNKGTAPLVMTYGEAPGTPSVSAGGAAASPASGDAGLRMTYGEAPGTAQTDTQTRQETRMDTEAETLLAAWDAKRAAEKRAEEIKMQLALTKKDIGMAQAAAKHGINTQRWSEADHSGEARLYAEALAEVRAADQPIREFMARRQAELQGNAQEAADWIARHAKDKRFGVAYQRETMERNIRDIFGKKNRAVADAIIAEYITPVHKAVAEGNRLKKEFRGRVKKLKLNKHESALVQMRLEGEDGAAAEYIENNGIRVTPEMDAKIRRGVEEFRSIYKELYIRLNETLLANGMEPVRERLNYAPHFVKDKPDTMLGKLRFALGLGKDSELTIPTDIAGITDEFRPGKKWFGNLLQREGEITDYDAVAGFDRYIETAADVITLTESVQKLRALEDATRYTLSDEGVKDQIDAIRADDSKDALQQRQAMEEVYGDNPTTAQQLIQDLKSQKQMGMGGFVTELRRYTDNLAGKKSKEDRGWEQKLNRQVYAVAKNMESRVAANMIALNPGSWLTNIIPITQASGEVQTAHLLAGMKDTVKAFVKDDGFADASDFLTNRVGSERLDRTMTQKAGDLAGAGMQLFDRIASQTIVRARTRQNIQNGMSLTEAIEDADAYAAGLMADRSKGAQPTMFNATNPITKTYTMFQIEVNNQLSYLFKDMPQAQRKHAVAGLAWGYTKLFVGAHLFNVAYSALTGRDAALDPIGWIMDALGVGLDEEEKEERTVWDAAESLAGNAAENLPFVGGFLGGGRVPVSAALPNLEIVYGSLSGNADPAKKRQTVGKELSKPLTYLLPPFGGGAVRRAVEGYQAVKQGGVYGMDNDGNRTLNFPSYGQKPKDYAQAMLFGRYSLPMGKKYIESGFQGKLNADDTALYTQLVQNGTDPQKAYEAIRAVGSAKAPEDGSKTSAQVKREAIMALDLSWEEKVELSRRLVGGDDMVSFYDQDSFELTNNVKPANQARAFALVRDQGMDIAQAKKYAELVDENGQTYTLGEDGHYTKDSKSTRLKKALAEIENDQSLSAEQRDGVARTVLLPELGKKYVGEYAGWFTEGLSVPQLIDAQDAYDKISDAVKKDTTIHENNRSEFTRVRFAEYLEGTGMSRFEQDKLWYFQSRGEDDFREKWSDVIWTGGEDIKAAAPGLEASKMDVLTYKVIKAGMDRIYSDKDAEGETIKDSKKNKLIAYLNQYPDLTAEQKNLLMKADGYKYGMGEKPRKGKKGGSKGLKTLKGLPTLKLPF